MSALEKIGKKELRELLSKGWITHDAMWVLHCLNELGVEKTNEINQAAVRSMAAIEVVRVMKALGHSRNAIDSFDKLVAFMTGIMELVKADFMRFAMTIPRMNVIHWDMEDGECFAYKGISRMGFIDGWECGLMPRIETWLDTLNVKYTMSPPVKQCLMHMSGKCQGNILFYFDK